MFSLVEECCIHCHVGVRITGVSSHGSTLGPFGGKLEIHRSVSQVIGDEVKQRCEPTTSGIEEVPITVPAIAKSWVLMAYVNGIPTVRFWQV